MRVLITGVAGFLGSHLAQACMQRSDEVVGVDSLTTFYDPACKQANLAAIAATGDMVSVIADVLDIELHDLTRWAEVVFHLAGVPGVRLVGATGAREHLRGNTATTEALLSALPRIGAPRVVLASSSSVYGEGHGGPMRVGDREQPRSSYGRSKLLAERAMVRAGARGLPTVSLRQFTVFGPRQRPDMAVHRFIAAALAGRTIEVFGDGHQVRDFTYVSDTVAALLAAGSADLMPGTLLNVGAGHPVSVNDVLREVAAALKTPLQIEHQLPHDFDVRSTWADIEGTVELLDWEPRVGLADGIEQQLTWQSGAREPALATG